jgi:hypothetical protein
LPRSPGTPPRFLPDLPEATDGKTLQVDLVAGAAELWAFPFEACSRNGDPRWRET